MKILILNSGSSSIKYQLIEMPAKKVVCVGMIERIGMDDGVIHYKSDKHNKKFSESIKNHHKGLEKIVQLLLDKEQGVLQNVNDIEVVGHRVVHGGSTFSKTVLINEEVKEKIKELFEIAPLHNPPNLEGIIVAERIFSKAKQVAVFDTAFHQTIPEKAFKYAIPNKFYTKHQIRVYGFHGTSHKFVSEKAIAYLNKKQSKIISIHLGNGCSITAIKNGKSVDHSLGFGPMNGLVMGTRSGDIDQSVLFYMVNSLGYALSDVNRILQKESGMLGLTGLSDLRDIEIAAKNGNTDCKMALEINAYRIKKYIGAYVAAMNGLDALVFTAGIGENSSFMRALVCDQMDFLGISLDKTKNRAKSQELREINSPSSKVKILVIPTNEELEIAKQSYQLVKKLP